MTRFIDPFDEMDRMLAAAGGRWRGGHMLLDAFEKDDVYVLRFDVAGVSNDDIDITVENNVLTVRAQRDIEDTVGANWIVRERPTGIHSRSVRLGQKLDVTDISAAYDNGVLMVSIPIKEEAKPQKIDVEVTSSREAIEASTV